MRIVLLIVLSISLIQFLWADKHTTQSPSLDTLLAQIKQAKGDARRKAMNRLKIYLRQSSQITRQEALHRLRRMWGKSKKQEFIPAGTTSMKQRTRQTQPIRCPTVQQTNIQTTIHRYQRPMQPSQRPTHPKPGNGGSMHRPGGRP